MELFGEPVSPTRIGELGPDPTPDALACASHEVPAPAGPAALVAEGDLWRYRAAPGALPKDWMGPGFDDSAWPEGPGGIGYGDDDDATVVALQNVAMTLFVRRSFAVEDPASLRDLTLVIDYDDGFVAYLNGVEVARRGSVAGHPSDAGCRREPQAGAPGDPRLLVPSSPARTCAIEVHNTSLSSSDLSCSASLLARPARDRS